MRAADVVKQGKVVRLVVEIVGELFLVLECLQHELFKSALRENAARREVTTRFGEGGTAAVLAGTIPVSAGSDIFR